jgi:hypothetical protein
MLKDEKNYRLAKAALVAQKSRQTLRGFNKIFRATVLDVQS